MLHDALGNDDMSSFCLGQPAIVCKTCETNFCKVWTLLHHEVRSVDPSTLDNQGHAQASHCADLAVQALEAFQAVTS